MVFVCLWGLTCGGDGTSIGFVILRAEELRPGSLTPRAGGLDREVVDEATCQILDSELATVASETFPVDPETTPGEQEARLQGIPEGTGYFARILGLDVDNARAVHECGVTGPFAIEGGKKHWVTIVIAPPPPDDGYCQTVCSSDADCPAGSYCPSPCARGETGECVSALCMPYSVGAPCSGAECGPSLSCVLPGYGFVGGYCTRTCGSDADCPQGDDWTSSCTPGTVAGLGTPICTLDCIDVGDCREGYLCRQTVDPKQGCLPPP